jgi:hypothetical protein
MKTINSCLLPGILFFIFSAFLVPSFVFGASIPSQTVSISGWSNWSGGGWECDEASYCVDYYNNQGADYIQCPEAGVSYSPHDGCCYDELNSVGSKSFTIPTSQYVLDSVTVSASMMFTGYNGGGQITGSAAGASFILNSGNGWSQKLSGFSGHPAELALFLFHLLETIYA